MNDVTIVVTIIIWVIGLCGIALGLWELRKQRKQGK